MNTNKKPKPELKELRLKARLAWNGWPDDDHSRKRLNEHEQKDPLLIYKLEAFKLFRSMLDGVNKEVISFLFKGDLPQQNNNIQEAKEVKRKENYIESKDDVEGNQSQNNSTDAVQNQPRQVTETIVRDQPKINRNDNVTIKHVMSGKTETDRKSVV